MTKNKSDKSNKNERQQPQDPTLNPLSPYYFHATDTKLKIVTNIFNGAGFKGWKRAVTIALSKQNNLGFINGTIMKAIHNQ